MNSALSGRERPLMEIVPLELEIEGSVEAESEVVAVLEWPMEAWVERRLISAVAAVYLWVASRRRRSPSTWNKERIVQG